MERKTQDPTDEDGHKFGEDAEKFVVEYVDQDENNNNDKPCKQEVNKSEKTVNSKECGKEFTMKKQLSNHKLYNHGQISECEICKKSFISKPKLQQHKKNVHDEKGNEMCDQCGKGFVKTQKINIYFDELMQILKFIV